MRIRLWENKWFSVLMCVGFCEELKLIYSGRTLGVLDGDRIKLVFLIQGKGRRGHDAGGGVSIDKNHGSTISGSGIGVVVAVVADSWHMSSHGPQRVFDVRGYC